MQVLQLEQVRQKDSDIPSSCRLRVFVHGPLEVWKREASGAWRLVDKDDWGKGRPARSVFKRLLVAPGRRLSRGSIQDDLWPDTENFELADKNVYNAINQIRRVTGKDLVRTFETVYEMADQSVIWVDRDACEVLLKEAENWGYTSREALSLLEQALTYLERGELLEGESGIWVYGLRKKSEDMLKQCRCWLAQAYECQGKLWQAGEQYRALCAAMPPDEEALQHWMVLLNLQGKPQEALKCYQDVTADWEAQGYPPSEALQKMVAAEQDREEPQMNLSRRSFLLGVEPGYWCPNM
jgi:DNA-binding SARP family transcriptional activator